MGKPDKEFERLVCENEQTLYSICYMYSRNDEDAKDLLQDTLVNLWSGYSRFRGDSSFRTWAIRVAINTCISYQRKGKPAMEEESYIPSISHVLPEEGKQIEHLHSRLKKLDYLDRAVVLLWLEDLSYDEIGAIVGMSPKNVGVRLVRIKDKLKNIKEDEQ